MEHDRKWFVYTTLFSDPASAPHLRPACRACPWGTHRLRLDVLSPSKNSRHWPVHGVFLSGRVLGVPPYHWRMAHRQDDATDGQGVVRGWSVWQPKPSRCASPIPPRRACALAAPWTSPACADLPPRSRVNSGATRWRGARLPRGRGRVGGADQQSGGVLSACGGPRL